LASEQDFKEFFYCNSHGLQLECLLFFLHTHKKIIIELMEGKRRTEILFELYTSMTISGNYDCFRFDMSKFIQTYTPKDQVLTLYRIGRTGECIGSLGCSWATSIEGLRAYCESSSISKSMLESKPVFVITIDDSQILFEGDKREHEFVLKPDFTHNTLAMLDDNLLNNLCR